MVSYKAARIAQRRAIAYETEGRTFLYIATSGRIGRIGTCTANGMQTLLSRGWDIEHHIYWQDNRPAALAAERAILQQIRDWDYVPVMASGSSGWTKSFDASVIPWAIPLLDAFVEQRPVVVGEQQATTQNQRIALLMLAAVAVGIMLTILLAGSSWTA